MLNKIGCVVESHHPPYTLCIPSINTHTRSPKDAEAVPKQGSTHYHGITHDKVFGI